MPPLLCLDLGNTHTHLGVAGASGVEQMTTLPTASLADPGGALAARLARLRAEHPALAGAAFCSVVPDATPRLRHALAAALPTLEIFQLTHERRLGVPLSYPHPAEVGQDRLANAAAAQALGVVPAVVIDLGTAVTFDVVTARGGYEGGVIAPGLAVMRHYLHDRTAQLPEIDGTLTVSRAIGQSTAEAMRIG